MLVLLVVVLLASACAPLGFLAEPTTTPTAAPQYSQPVLVDTSPTTPDAPTAQPTPQPSPQPTATPLPPDEVALLDAAQRTPHNRVLLARAFTGNQDAPMVARTTPLDVQLGHTRQFWVTNFVDNSNQQVTAELRYAGPVVLMYVEQGASVDPARLEEAAQTFENEIYPRTRALFGSEWQPGVDGDSRIVILNVQHLGGGVIGYFSPRDSVPAEVNRFSNEHEMFYMNAGTVPPGSTAYLDTLAHEFQHMIHWNEQRDASTWFNEGNSTLSEDLNGFQQHSFAATYLRTPDVQLTAWAELPGASLAHYGAAHLFMRYIYAHYAGEAGLKDLVRANAGNNLNAFVALAHARRPYIDDFGDLFADWAVANLLNDPTLADGQYGYNNEVIGWNALPATSIPVRSLNSGATFEHVDQFGADYFSLPAGAQALTFTGGITVGLVGALPQGQHAWWSGRSDNSVATLTRAFDLRGLERATLHFDSWYEIEQHYDYAFVSVSTDGGTTWQTLPGTHTTEVDPHGANYGHGLTGVSGLPGQPTSIQERGMWVQETMDLTPYAGQEVLLRFWQVNDEGFNAPGILLDNIRIPELGYRDEVEAGDAGWQAEGFVRVDGDLEQHWELRLITSDADGSTTITPLPVDAQGQASAALGGPAQLVVMATTPYTTEPASYQLAIK